MKKLKIPVLSRSVNCWLYILGVVLTSFVVVLAPSLVQNGITDPVVYTYFLDSKYLIPFAMVIFSAALVAITSLVRNFSLPASLLMVLSAAIGVANTNKLVYRNSPILPSDIALAKDALFAAAEYPVVISKSFWVIAVGAVLFGIVTLPIRVPVASGKNGMSKAIMIAATVAVSAAVIALVILGVFFNGALLDKLRYHHYPKQIDHEYQVNTFYPAFLKTMGDNIVTAPEGYSEARMAIESEEIQSLSAAASAGIDADIIVLQLESFFIPTTYDLIYDETEVFGTFTEIMNEGAGGYLIPFQRGGGTADVEFEVLTGFTTTDGQMPTNPYGSKVYDGFPGITGYLEQRGYSTAAIHSHSDTLYNRRNVYQSFGFDQAYFSDSFVNPKTAIGSFIKDESCVDKIIEVYESMPEENGRFIHAVTMQNHLPLYRDNYSADDLVPAESDTLSGTDLDLLRVFLTSSKEISEQVARLKDYLESLDRNVIVVCYGDHQSSIVEHVDNVAYYVAESDGVGSTDEEKYLSTHCTPYFIWTNFESGIEGESLGYLSPNSLLVTALCRANVVRPAYFQYLADSTDTIKCMVGDAAILADDTLVFNLSEQMQKELEPRRYLQHDIMYGKRYLLDDMY